jgi:small ligand-binding sensory domain FIST
VSLSLASLPGVAVRSFHLSSDDLPDLDSPPSAWVDLVNVPPEDKPHFILMADPFSSNINDLLQGLDFAYPEAVKIGGLASVDSFNQNSGLFCDRTLHQTGIVGVALSGDIMLDTIVAQGCRPIGLPYQVAEAERNIILSLRDPPQRRCPPSPLELLQEMFQTLSEADRMLAQSSLVYRCCPRQFQTNLRAWRFFDSHTAGG